ncbi:MAG: hypothetical protein C0496_08710 [Erythrobacter sp.]|nr:hypothetical protein [Erythrobacter sp.]
MRFTTKVGAGLMCCAAGTITGYTTARDSYPEQPPVPGFWDVMGWLVSGSDGWAVAAALFAFFSAAYSIWEMFQPGPQTEEEARQQHDRVKRSFAAADERQEERHGQDMAGHHTTQAELAALREQIAALTQTVAQTNPGQAAGFAEAAEKLVASGDESDIDLAREVAAGRPEEAADALMREVHEGKQRNAERARLAARLYAPTAPSKAKAAYEEAVALDPTDLWSWIELGRLRMAYDSLAAARQCFGEALQQVTDARHRMVIHNELGNILRSEGQLPSARIEFEAGFAIAKRLAATAPSHTKWQHDLSVSHEKIGDVDLQIGNLAAARKRFEASIAIRERIAAAEPGDVAWQRDLSVSYDKLGEIERAAGNLAAARLLFESSLAICGALAAAEPENAGWQNDLSISFERLGDIELATGNLTAARTRFESKLAIDLRLVNLDASNSKWQRDLAVSFIKLGDVEQAASNLVAARARFEDSLAIFESLAAADPGNAEWQRDLSVSYGKLGDVEQQVGNLVAARARFEASLAIFEGLVASEPGNAKWQRDLWAYSGKLGQLSLAEGETERALKHLFRAEAIMAALVAQRPDHPGFARDLDAVRSIIAHVEQGTAD